MTVETIISPLLIAELAEKMLDAHLVESAKQDRERGRHTEAEIQSEIAKQRIERLPSTVKYVTEFVAAMQEKDIELLTRKTHNMNIETVKIFERLTGIKCGRTNKGITAGLRQYVGDEAYDAWNNSRKEARETRDADAKKACEEREAKEQLDKSVRSSLEGEEFVTSYRDLIDRIYAKGYEPTEITVGFNHRVRMQREHVGGGISYIDFKKKWHKHYCLNHPRRIHNRAWRYGVEHLRAVGPCTERNLRGYFLGQVVGVTPENVAEVTRRFISTGLNRGSLTRYDEGDGEQPTWDYKDC